MDAGLAVFRRQYLQCLEPDFLAWPDPLLLKEADVQRWLYEQLFDTDRISRLPPERYQFRVLKPLVTKIERSIRDPEEDVCCKVLTSPRYSLLVFETHRHLILSTLSRTSRMTS
jgi:hypothetical protein